MEIIRKNEVTFRATFKPIPGTVGVPSVAYVKLVYTNTGGQSATETIPMNGPDADGVWTATWDTRPARDGEVFWSVWCEGGLKAADEGMFRVKANAASKG